MPSAELTTRDLTTDDLDAAVDVRTRSFGPLTAEGRRGWRLAQQGAIDSGRAMGVFDGEQLVGHAKARGFRQYWGGRSLPMAGVAGVVVAPEHRGRGVGSRLMSALLARSVELGDVVSALYPATVPVYRKLGWEVAGAQYRVSIEAAQLRVLGGRGVSAGATRGAWGRGAHPGADQDVVCRRPGQRSA